MNILEDNRKIAVFMGLDHRIERHDIFYMPAWKPGIGGQAEGSLIYRPYKDWNQLMEAKDLMESDGDTIVTIGHKECTITSCGDIMTGQKPIHKDADTTKAAVYQAVLEYIKKEK